MLERNRLQPPRPSSPSPTAGWFDGVAAGCSGLFASPEDFDATGILAGVDPCESRYWWMPELFTSQTLSSQTLPSQANIGEATMATSSGESENAGRDVSGIRRSGLAERLMRSGQATRRTGSRSPAAA
jgi:hypothetical protein